MSLMCVDCGADSMGLIGGSCAACFTARETLMVTPEVVDLELCAHCGARRAGSHWHDIDADVPEKWTREDAAREAAAVHQEVVGPVLHVLETPQDAKHFLMSIRLEGSVQDVEVSAEASLTLRRRQGVCDRCSRIAGGYYAAILQLRATDRDVNADELERSHKATAAELGRQLQAGNRFAFLAKEGAMHGGWDYYIGDIDAARNVARILKNRLSATVLETAKLVGRREGNDVHRVTFLVRIRAFAPGDHLIAADTPHAVLAVHPNNLATMDLETHRKGRIAEGGCRRLGGSELLEQATIVDQSGRDVQIIDPRNFQTVTIRAPDGWRSEGDSVWVLRHDEQLHWVPQPNKS